VDKVNVRWRISRELGNEEGRILERWSLKEEEEEEEEEAF
jgi:hypothetical protein